MEYDNAIKDFNDDILVLENKEIDESAVINYYGGIIIIRQGSILIAKDVQAS